MDGTLGAATAPKNRLMVWLALLPVGNELQSRYAQVVAAVVRHEWHIVPQRRSGDPGVGALYPTSARLAATVTSAHIVQSRRLYGSSTNRSRYSRNHSRRAGPHLNWMAHRSSSATVMNEIRRVQPARSAS